MGRIPRIAKNKILLSLILTILYTGLIIPFLFYSELEFLLHNIQAKDTWNGLLAKLELNDSSSTKGNTKIEVQVQNDSIDQTTITKKKGDLPHYFIKATMDDQAFKINGEVELTMYNPGTEKILFYAYPYDWAPMKIQEVKLNDELVPFEFDQQNLIFNNQMEAEEIQIRIQFETPVPREGTRFGVKDDVWLITTWYPILGVLDDQNQWLTRPNPIGRGDPFYFRFADYTIEWTSSPSIKWVSSGTIRESEMLSEDMKKITWKVDQVRNFALVGSPHFEISTFKLNDETTVSVALSTPDKAETVIDITKYTLTLFRSIYGKLPYSDIAIVETSYGTNYALEYPNLAIYSKDMYVNDQIEHWIPHEIGHLWWYNAVGVDETVHGWLDEGLAEQGVALYLEHRYFRGKELGNKFREKNHALTHNYPNQMMDVGLYGFSNYQEFHDSWYARPADMFLTLKEAIGNQNYVKFLKTLYRNNIGKMITQESLDEALEDALGLKTDFFHRWVHEPYHKTDWKITFTNTKE